MQLFIKKCQHINMPQSEVIENLAKIYQISMLEAQKKVADFYE